MTTSSNKILSVSRNILSEIRGDVNTFLKMFASLVASGGLGNTSLRSTHENIK